MLCYVMLSLALSLSAILVGSARVERARAPDGGSGTLPGARGPAPRVPEIAGATVASARSMQACGCALSNCLWLCAEQLPVAVRCAIACGCALCNCLWLCAVR